MACFDGQSALKLVEEFQPAIVLLDLGMAGMSGYEVCQRLRSNPQHGAMFILAQTGWGDPQTRRRTEEVGFSDHMTKPVDLPLLMTKLHAHMEKTYGEPDL